MKKAKSWWTDDSYAQARAQLEAQRRKFHETERKKLAECAFAVVGALLLLAAFYVIIVRGF